MNTNDIVKPIFIEGLRRAISWYESDKSIFLRSIFDQIGFKDKDISQTPYFVTPMPLSAAINFPVLGNSERFTQTRENTLQEIKKKHSGFSDEYLNSLSSNQLWFLLEKYACNTPFDDSGSASIYDTYKVKASQAVIHSNRQNLKHSDNLFINVDLSGIQKFIYNISSSGALKNLRSRSFFIELLSNHIIQKVIKAFDVHPVNVLMNGGGSIYIHSSCPDDYQRKLHDINVNFNKWLLNEFNGRLFSAFSCVRCSDEEIKSELPKIFEELSLKTYQEKQAKFKAIIEEKIYPFLDSEDPRYHGCEVCYRDDSRTTFYRITENEGRFRCSVCSRLVEIGNQIPKTKYIYECSEGPKSVRVEDSYYLLSPDEQAGLTCLWVLYDEDDGFISKLRNSATHVFAKTYTKTNKELPTRVHNQIAEVRKTLSALSNQEHDSGKLKKIEEEIETLADDNIATLENIAESSDGAKLIGALRVDADNVGKIIRYGFYGQMTLEKLSFYSRSINYFFKLHLDTMCSNHCNDDCYNTSTISANNSRKNVQVIYAGGDDLFVLGAWNDTASLAVEIGEAFKRYTCGNIDHGISGGLTLHDPKFPVSQMAEFSMTALQAAKNDNQPCWMCRKNWIDCPLLDSGSCLRKNSLSLFFTDYMAFRKRKIDDKNKTPKYSPEPSRLKLSLKWQSYDATDGTIINEVDEYVIKPLKSFVNGSTKISRVFFHNVLALLDSWYDEGTLYLPKIVWILEKFKNQLKRQKINGASEETLYDLYEMYLHIHDSKRFSTLHIPLIWNILLMKGAKNSEKAD